MTHRKELLEKAIGVTCGPRDEEYGSPKYNLANTAALWNAYLQAKFPYPGDKVVFDAEDVAWLNTLQKISRATSGQAGDDTYLDAAGYAAIAGEVRYGTKAAQEEFPEPYFTCSGDGKTTVFSYPFFLSRVQDLEVKLNGVVQDVNYRVFGTVDLDGGTMAFDIAPCKDAIVTLSRKESRT